MQLRQITRDNKLDRKLMFKYRAKAYLGTAADKFYQASIKNDPFKH